MLKKLINGVSCRYMVIVVVTVILCDRGTQHLISPALAHPEQGFIH